MKCSGQQGHVLVDGECPDGLVRQAAPVLQQTILNRLHDAPPMLEVKNLEAFESKQVLNVGARRAEVVMHDLNSS